MRGLILFVAGLGCGLAMQTALAQSENAGVSINHVGLAVPSIPDAAAWYRDKMGFKEAFRNSDQQGNITGMYIQVSKYTFIELQTVNAQRPAGISHFGMEAQNIENAVKFFKAHGAMATEPGAPSAFSKARLANVTEANGLRIELAELGPESLQRKASEAWK